MNLGERRDVALRAKQAKISAMQDANVIRDLMSSPHGRAWMLRKLESAHVFAISFTPNANQTAFNEGERNVGLQLLNDIMLHCPDRYLLMMQERNSHDDAIASAAERSREQDSRGSTPESGFDYPAGHDDGWGPSHTPSYADA